MPLRLRVGAITVEADGPEAAEAFLRSLLRHLSNQEVAHLLGVTDKTVRRWQRSGRLPHRPGGQTVLLELLAHLDPHPVPGRGDATPALGEAPGIPHGPAWTGSGGLPTALAQPSG